MTRACGLQDSERRAGFKARQHNFNSKRGAANSGKYANFAVGL